MAISFQDKFEQIFEEDVMSAGAPNQMEGRSSKFFVNKKIKYVWDALAFVKLKSIDETLMQGDFHKAGSGMGQYDVNDKLLEYGENVIKISVPPIMFLVLHEVGQAGDAAGLSIEFGLLAPLFCRP